MLRVTACAAVAAAVLGLSGCGVSGTDFRPGVAADVGNDRIFTEDVDDAVDKACDYFTDEGSGEAFPKSQLRGELLQLVVQRSAVEQLLEENDVTPPAVPDSAIEDFLASQFAGASESQADGLRIGAEAVILVQSGLSTLGSQLLSEEGTPVDPSQAEVAAQRGFEELSQWLLDNDVEINPVYGIALNDEGQLSPDTDETSVVESDEARFGSAPEAGETASAEQQSYLDGLPASQTCG